MNCKFCGGPMEGGGGEFTCPKCDAVYMEADPTIGLEEEWTTGDERRAFNEGYDVGFNDNLGETKEGLRQGILAEIVHKLHETGLSQSTIARVFEVNQSTISRWMAQPREED